MSYFPSVQLVASGTLNGTYVPAATMPVTADNNRLNVAVTYDDGINMDAFNRLRVSTPGYRFDGQFVYQFNTDVWDYYSSGGAVTFDSVNRLSGLSTSSGTNWTAIQSHYYAPYTPGRSQLSFMTFNMLSAPSAGQTKRVGYFDSVNGVYLEWDATNGISVNIRSGTANGKETATQSNWNIDRLDGTGPSGITLDLTKTQIFFVQLQALYVGRVVVGFDINGVLTPVHQFVHANKSTAPYVQQASLPIRYELSGTNSSSGTLNAICASVMSEGGAELLDIPGRAFSANLSTTLVTISTRRPLITVQPKSTFNSLVNNTVLVPQKIAVANNAGATTLALIEIVRNGTITGPANTPYVDVDSTNSAAQYNTNGTTISGGQTIYTAYLNSTSNIAVDIDPLSVGRNLLAYSTLLSTNAADSISVVATAVAGSPSLTAGVGWKEIR